MRAIEYGVPAGFTYMGAHYSFHEAVQGYIKDNDLERDPGCPLDEFFILHSIPYMADTDDYFL